MMLLFMASVILLMSSLTLNPSISFNGFHEKVPENFHLAKNVSRMARIKK